MQEDNEKVNSTAESNSEDRGELKMEILWNI